MVFTEVAVGQRPDGGILLRVDKLKETPTTAEI